MQKKLNKILFVEDEPDIYTITQLALEDIGKFTVKYCKSGEEALQCAEDFAPDLILLDMMMPGMDGLTTLNKLHQIDALKQTPVIFMTAKAQDNEITIYCKAGAIDVIAKPFDPMTLAENLKKIWENYNE